MVHLVSGLRGCDGILAVENDVLLLGFVGIHPVDLLRDGLQLLLGYGITAAGEALWEELGEGYLRARRRPEGGNCVCASPSRHLLEAGSKGEGLQSGPAVARGQGPQALRILKISTWPFATQCPENVHAAPFL